MSKRNINPELLDKITGQLKGLHEEISVLSKKNPESKINDFKIGYINSIISQANELLQDKYLPFLGFTCFDSELLPTYSDIVFVLAQYINCIDCLSNDCNRVFLDGKSVLEVECENRNTSIKPSLRKTSKKKEG